MDVYSVLSHYAHGSLFPSKHFMNTVGDKWVHCSPSDKEVLVMSDSAVGKWRWLFHLQDDGSYVIQNVRFGGALFCSQKTFERNGIWGYAVGLSPHDKEGENLGTAGKWRWKIVDTIIESKSTMFSRKVCYM